jgi:hypothetical protein
VRIGRGENSSAHPRREAAGIGLGLGEEFGVQKKLSEMLSQNQYVFNLPFLGTRSPNRTFLYGSERTRLYFTDPKRRSNLIGMVSHFCHMSRGGV